MPRLLTSGAGRARRGHHPAPPTPTRRLLPVAAACLLSGAGAAWAQAPAAAAPLPEADAPLRLIKSTAPRGSNAGKERDKALVLRADRSTSRLGKTVSAEGGVELRYGETLLRTEALELTEARNEVVAPGEVRIEHLGSQIQGRALRLELDAFLGELLAPTYRIAQTGGSGQAQRLDFLGEQRLRADAASYSSCPAWTRRASR